MQTVTINELNQVSGGTFKEELHITNTLVNGMSLGCLFAAPLFTGSAGYVLMTAGLTMAPIGVFVIGIAVADLALDGAINLLHSAE